MSPPAIIIVSNTLHFFGCALLAFALLTGVILGEKHSASKAQIFIDSTKSVLPSRVGSGDTCRPGVGGISSTRTAENMVNAPTASEAGAILPEAGCRDLPYESSNGNMTKPSNNDTHIMLQAKEILRQEAGYDVDSAHTIPKRSDYIGWDDYFMAVAVLSSFRSKDPKSPSGCCIVDGKNRIIGIGYNGFPMMCSDDILPWVEPAENIPFLHTFEPYVVSAVKNAILCSGDVNRARLYVSEFPSNECAKVAIQANISEIIYQKEPSEEEYTSDSLTASRIMLQMAGVKTRAHAAVQDQVELVFSTSDPPMDDTPLSDSTKNAKEEDCSIFERNLQLVQKEANLEVPKTPTKRLDFLSWDDYFMWMAFLTAKRSKDPNTQVGACIVLNNRIVALGYNGFPNGCSDDCLPWSRQGSSHLHTKYPYVCHAELNAIMNRIFPEIRGASIYVDLFPCHECAKVIIQVGIREVVYLEDKYHDTDSCRASRIMFGMAGVKLRQHTPSLTSLCLQLDTQTRP